MGYALKWTNHLTDAVYCQGNHLGMPFNFVEAYDALRRELNDMPADWMEGEDFDVEVVEVEDDFEFSDQPDWN